MATGNIHIDALVGESFVWKNSDFALGTPVRITVAITSSRPDDWPAANFFPLTGTGAASYGAQYVQWIREAMTGIEQQVGIDFVETTPALAVIRFGAASLSSGTAGYAQTGYDTTTAGYVTNVVLDDSLLSSANARTTVVHELAHALGLKHPADYGGDTGPYLPTAINDTNNTAMSYNFVGTDSTALRPFDVEALRYLYGPAISAATKLGIPSTAAVRVGTAANEMFALNSLSLWERNPTSFTDIGSGFKSAAKGISIDAGAGVDAVYVPLNLAQVQVSRQTDGSLQLVSTHTIKLSSANGTLTLTDTVRNVERLEFANTKIAYDLSGNAGDVAKILGAVFGKAAVSNASYAGIGLQLRDGGMSYVDLAALAADAAGLKAPAALVNQLWLNVVGTAPSSSDVAPFIDMLARGTTAGELVKLAADTDLNTTNIGLVGLQISGLTYSG